VPVPRQAYTPAVSPALISQAAVVHRPRLSALHLIVLLLAALAVLLWHAGVDVSTGVEAVTSAYQHAQERAADYRTLDPAPFTTAGAPTEAR
jgi:hypothetical protein